MDIARKFEDHGINVIKAASIMKTLGVSSSDFLDEARYLRFKDVVDFFSKYENGEAYMSNLLIGKTVNKLDHVWGYQELAKQRANLQDRIEGIKSEFMLPLDDIGRMVVEDRLRDVESQHGEILNQMEKYEV